MLPKHSNIIVKYFHAIKLFLFIVYGDWYGEKISAKTAWEVSKNIWLKNYESGK